MDKPLISPYAMNAAKFEIGLGHDATAFDDYTEAVSQAEITPTSSSAAWQGIGGNSINFATPSTWAATVAHAQDSDEEGLTWFLFEHDNEKATIRLTPDAGGPAIVANVTLLATAIGGTAGTAAATGTATFPIQGKPTRVAPVGG